jgi:hypothetical protein
MRFGEIDGEVFIDAPAATVFEKRDASSVDLFVFVFELYAEELLERIEVERVDAGCRVVTTADVGTGEYVGCLALVE